MNNIKIGLDEAVTIETPTLLLHICIRENGSVCIREVGNDSFVIIPILVNSIELYPKTLLNPSQND